MNSEARHEARYQRRKRKRLEKASSVCGRTFEEVFTYDNLYNAGLLCCNGVRWKTSTINFESHLLTEIARLHNQLMKGTYRARNFQHFRLCEHGKMREINALSIQDRTVQRCLCDQIMTKAYSRSYIYDNSASLEDRGMLFALDRMKWQLQQHWRQYGLKGGIWQFDFRHYFDSIPHEGAKERVHEKLWDERLQKVTCNLIDDFKRMLNYDRTDPIARGVGLGSQVSQNVALDYVNPIDHYIKDVCRVKGYGRYMDDGYVISDSLEELQQIKEAVEALAQEYGVYINPKKSTITPFKGHSFKFLKIRFRLWDTGKVTRKLNRNSICSMRRKIPKFKKMLDEGIMQFDLIVQSYQSWRGYSAHFDSFRSLVNMDKKFFEVFSEELPIYMKQHKHSFFEKMLRMQKWEIDGKEKVTK